jgi:hypothetical protein
MYKTIIKIKWKYGSLLSNRADIKSAVFWEVMPCRMKDVYWHFGGMYYLYLEGQRVSQASNKLLYILHTNLNMEVVHPSKTMVNMYQTTWYNISEDSILHSHYCENLKSYAEQVLFTHIITDIKQKLLTSIIVQGTCVIIYRSSLIPEWIMKL